MINNKRKFYKANGIKLKTIKTNFNKIKETNSTRNSGWNFIIAI
uniref:Uncharacterized protein n=1 Tax=Meloidogyne enterolobii TaxID=390850 RepID=A0A6V7UC40_MELEN|nr:unnamed protein product [Meloidogyne enterolobii]